MYRRNPKIDEVVSYLKNEILGIEDNKVTTYLSLLIQLYEEQNFFSEDFDLHIDKELRAIHYFYKSNFFILHEFCPETGLITKTLVEK